MYGNHNRQEDREERSYTAQELEQAITDNGIIVLQDKYVRIGNDLILAGRDDMGLHGKSERLWGYFRYGQNNIVNMW